MASHRFLTIAGLAAAFFLIATTGTSFAHPGNGHRHAHSTRHAQATPHGTHPARHGSIDAWNPSSSSRPIDMSGGGHAFGRTHADLASHPGKALGLFKHTQRPPLRNPQPSNPPPPGPTGGGGEPGSPTPTGQLPAPHSTPTPTPNEHTGPPPATGPPISQPPSQQPPVAEDPTGLGQVLAHSNPSPFTVLPIVVVSMLALGVCGLIGLARHRA